MRDATADWYRVDVEFTRPVYGMNSRELKELHRQQMAAPADLLDEEEAALPEASIPQLRVFFRDDQGRPAFANYQMLGAMKGTCSDRRRNPQSLSKKLAAWRKVLSGQLYVHPRFIGMDLPEGMEMAMEEIEEDMPLETRRVGGSSRWGPQTALVTSETLPPGTTMTFYFEILSSISEKLLREWLDFGEHYIGFGARRRDHEWGRFTYTLTKLDGPPPDLDLS